MTVGVPVAGVTHPKAPDKSFDGTVAVISLTGSRGGTLVLYCHQPVAIRLAARMLGMNGHEPDDEMVRDAIGELVNQTAGTIKRRLCASEQEIVLSVPLVVQGTPLVHYVKSTTDPLTVELETSEGVLCMCLWKA